MKILFVPKELPHGKVIGGPILVYNRIKYLSRNHEIGLASFMREGDKQYLGTLEPYVSELELTPYPPPRGRRQKISDFLFSEVPPYMCNTKSEQMRETVASMTRCSNYDVVIAEYLVMGQYLYKNAGLNPRTKRVISCHESYTIARKRVRDFYGVLSPMGFQAMLDLHGLEAYEFALYAGVDKVITLTPQERDGLLTYRPDLDIDVVPHGTDTDFFSPAPPEAREFSVAFLGNYPHDPNRDAAMHFIGDMWPQIKGALPGIKLYVIGRGPTPDIRAAAQADQDIVVTGQVDDVREYLGRARVFVAPIRLGRGFRGKNLEAMAMGIPVVTTSLGAEGIPVDNGNNILIADDVDTFVTQTIRLFKDSEFYERISRNARKLVEDRFSYQKGVEILEQVLCQVVEGGK
jgi:glycosyltransferase involved in cell wall biosynthesis